MTKEREALKLALVIAELRQAHAGHTNEGPSTFSDAADLLEALTQPEQKRPQNCGSGFCSCIKCVMEPEQEPVARIGMINEDHFSDVCRKAGGDSNTPLYAAPQKRKEWVGLTDEEWSDLYEAHHDKYNLPKQGSPDGMDYERAIEAKLKKLNT